MEINLALFDGNKWRTNKRLGSLERYVVHVLNIVVLHHTIFANSILFPGNSSLVASQWFLNPQMNLKYRNFDVQLNRMIARHAFQNYFGK